jgi:hypothetical protein
MEKLIKDGNVAVIISTNWGSGWSSWNPQYPQLLFEPKIVQMILDDRQEEITQQWLIDNLGLPDVWIPSPDTLKIEWVPQGSRFLIDEYDGSETLILEEDLNLHTA